MRTLLARREALAQENQALAEQLRQRAKQLSTRQFYQITHNTYT
jgi:hypothetical protein